MLRPGEPADSERVVAQSGPRAATLLHRAADAEQQGWENTMNVAYDGIRDEVAGYLELARHFSRKTLAICSTIAAISSL